MTQFRKDPVSGRWVIIADERSDRPRQLNAVGERIMNHCPFCAGNESETPPEVLVYDRQGPTKRSRDWRVRVVPNKYPAVTEIAGNPQNSGLLETKAGIGVHEVIIEHPQHVTDICELSSEEFFILLKVYRQRIAALSDDPRWRSIIIYKNQGERAGATLEHIHSQLIALPMVPREIAEELAQARQYYATHQVCLACDLWSRELSQRERVVATNTDFVALCPFAPRFAYETWLWPIKHQSAFESCGDDELISLSRILRELLIRITSRLNHTAFNFIIHSAPLPVTMHKDYHWHIEILPKLNQAAGFEWGSGSFINPVSPEKAAELLRTGS